MRCFLDTLREEFETKHSICCVNACNSVSLHKKRRRAMRTISRISAIVAFVMLFCVVSANDAEAEGIQFDVGVGTVISPEYRDMLEDRYFDVEGGWGWWELRLGLRYNVNEQFSVTPTGRLLLNYVDVLGDDSYVNTIVVPSVVLRYAFNQNPSFFISGEVNYNIPNSGSDLHEFESGGIGYGGTLGYVFTGDWSIEAGYSYIPVEVDTGNENIGGGVVFRFGASF